MLSALDSGSADNSYVDLGYSGYYKKVIQLLLFIICMNWNINKTIMYSSKNKRIYYSYTECISIGIAVVVQVIVFVSVLVGLAYL